MVDELVGQRRSKVQVLLKPYRILDYKKEREVHSIQNGIHQTVLFENDTCRRFYWAVTPAGMDRFKELLNENGYVKNGDGFAKDSLLLAVRELNSGKATLFIASLSSDLTGKRDASGTPISKKRIKQKQQEAKQADNSNEQYIPLMQQIVAEEKLDTTPKPKRKKDPTKHWVGTPSGRTTILGWEK